MLWLLMGNVGLPQNSMGHYKYIHKRAREGESLLGCEGKKARHTQAQTYIFVLCICMGPQKLVGV